MSTYYAVNQKTKVHRVTHMNGPTSIDETVLEADDEGWIKWDGGTCPLPGEQMVEVRFLDGECGKETASLWDWAVCGGYSIIAYRPVLEQEKPEPDIDWSKAPEGATHYSTGNGRFYREDSRGIMHMFTGDRQTKECNHITRYNEGSGLIPRPVTTGNSWHERGELPPVETVCEALLGTGWRRVTVRYSTGDEICFEEDGELYISSDPKSFRPIKTDRERTIEAARRVTAGKDDDQNFYDALYDAGMLRLKDD